MAYKILKNKENVYVPNMGIEYPQDDPFFRMLKVEVEDSSKGKYQFDENYPYLDTSLKYKVNDILGFVVKWFLAAVWNRLHYGLKVEGKNNLQEYQQDLANGAICICNHVYIFDALCVYQAIRRFKRLWIPMYAKHFNGKLGWFMRYAGGIPIPENKAGFIKFNEAFDEFNRRKQWMLFFPESVRWNWYQPIRPFKKGAFSMAYKYNAPIIPTVITYRKRTFLYKLFGKSSLPCVTIHIGKPIFIDKTIPKNQEINRLRDLSHESMVKMAGIEINPWPSSMDDDN